MVLWGLGTCPEYNNDDTTLWDPATNTFTSLVPENVFSEMFCGGHAALADGRVLVVGGGCHGGYSNRARLYGGSGGPWEEADPMEYRRFYPTVTTLPDGRVLVTSGSDDQLGAIAQIEVYDPNSPQNTWQTLDDELYDGPLYPLMFVLPSGDVFFAGPGPATINDGSGPVGGYHWVFDVDTGHWTAVTTPVVLPGDPLADHSMLSGVMYQPGKVLKAGGGISYKIDMTGTNPDWTQHATMNVDRHDLDLVLLPDGRVLAIGGDENDRACEWTDPNDSDPAQWHELAEIHDDLFSEYHSIALLLPDGRVLATGGATSENNIADSARAQLFSPPYLLWGYRPTIAWCPRAVDYDEIFRVTLVSTSPVGGEEIDRVTMVRPGAVTHSFDQNQRFIELDFTFDAANNRVEITSPLNSNVAPPGEWMLFLISDTGVPSVGKFIRLTLP